jgi:hypothetical protein
MGVYICPASVANRDWYYVGFTTIFYHKFINNVIGYAGFIWSEQIFSKYKCS